LNEIKFGYKLVGDMDR